MTCVTDLRCRVKLHAQGIELRDKISGALIKTKRQQRCYGDDFLVAEIDAKMGGYGIVPPALEGAVVSSHYFLFNADRTKLDPRYLGYFARSARFASQVKARGTTNYAAIRPTDVLGYSIPLPPLAEQQRLAARLDAIETRLTHVRQLREEQTQKLQAALRSTFHRLEADAEWRPMSAVAPIVRREITVDPEGSYPELGIRSFGRGTFHKPNLSGFGTTKRLFEIHTGDLVFNIVFAWEGAVAVAQPADHGRFGSHRFISCVCDPARISTEVLAFYFQTPDGIAKLGQASPGGAGRNRTLGVSKLEEMLVPVPPLAAQREFQKLLALQTQVAAHAAGSESATTALLPSLLDQIFGD